MRFRSTECLKFFLETDTPAFMFMVSGLKFEVSGSGFEVSGLRFEVSGSGFEVSSLRFKVSVSWFGADVVEVAEEAQFGDGVVEERIGVVVHGGHGAEVFLGDGGVGDGRGGIVLAELGGFVGGGGGRCVCCRWGICGTWTGPKAAGSGIFSSVLCWP